MIYNIEMIVRVDRPRAVVRVRLAVSSQEPVQGSELTVVDSDQG